MISLCGELSILISNPRSQPFEESFQTSIINRIRNLTCRQGLKRRPHSQILRRLFYSDFALEAFRREGAFPLNVEAIENLSKKDWGTLEFLRRFIALFNVRPKQTSNGRELDLNWRISMKALSHNVTSLCAINELNRIPLFRGLSSSELIGLDPFLRRKDFPAGTILMTAEQPGETIYFILEGTVKVHAEQSDGTDVILAILGPGEMIGEISALDGQGRSAGVVTLEAARLMWMDRALFQRSLANIPALSYNLACHLAQRLRQANEQIQSLAALETETRLARRLLEFARRYGKPNLKGGLLIPIRLTQSELGALIGASREHTNKIMVSYKERGYLSVDPRHYVTIHDLDAITRRGVN